MLTYSIIPLILILIVGVISFLLNYKIIAFLHLIIFFIVSLFVVKNSLSLYKSKLTFHSLFSSLLGRFLFPLVLASLLFVVVFFTFSVTSFRLDLSPKGSFSLAAQTLNQLDQLKSKYNFYLLDVGDTISLRQDQEVLNLFKATLAADNFNIRIVSPLYEPDLVNSLGFQRNTRLAIKQNSGDDNSNNSLGVALLKDITESEIMSALMRLENTREAKINYSVGHGEPELVGDQVGNLSRFYELANAERVTINEVMLDQDGLELDSSIPLFLVAPRKQLSELSIAKIKEHILGGGTLVVAAEYYSVVEGALDFVKQFGVDLKPRPLVRMIESETGERHVTADLSTRMYRDHPITSFLKGNASIVFSEAIPLVKTTADDELKINRVDEILSFQTNTKERVGLAFLSESSFGGKILIIGDSSWITNGYISRGFNSEFSRGLLLWSTGIIESAASGLMAKNQGIVASITEAHKLMINMLFVLTLEISLLIGYLLFSFRRRRAARHRENISDDDTNFNSQYHNQLNQADFI